ncbi:WGR domain-containing protein [Streptomyces sp. CAU 1734]|uniref:WGR domain-containing protein n=1 Tax=Streptomyces sp. CAU 1734 TaxID=3140360 RepID=UPI0032610BED
MTSSDDVLGFGWELHYEDGNSNKFYRLIVVADGESSIALGLHGARGGTGQIGLRKDGITAVAALAEVVKRTREKEKKGYEPSREFTTFLLPASIARTRDGGKDAHEIARHFGRSARQKGSDLPNASVIPGSDF